MKHSRHAFTLMELLVVVAIIGILGAMLLPNLTGRSQAARIARAQTEIRSTLAVALGMFESDTGRYPTTDQGLQALKVQPEGVTNWHGSYLGQGSRLVDPWGNKYQYQYPSQDSSNTYDLASAGPDGQFGTEDDISNAEKDEDSGTNP